MHPMPFEPSACSWRRHHNRRIYVATSLFATCPPYLPFGISTRRKAHT